MRYDELLDRIKSRTRIFSGKKYVLFDYYDEKSDAQIRANMMRCKGTRARVIYIPSAKVCAVYENPIK